MKISLIILELFLLILFLRPAQAVQTCDRKTCIEGTNFDIKRVKQLVVEGREVEGYGNWQQRQMQVRYRELATGWMVKVTEDTARFYGGVTGASITYNKVKEWEPAVQLQLKEFISNRLGISQDNIGGYITVGYVTDARNPTIPVVIDSLNYQYRDKIKRFEITREHWKPLNTNSQRVIESNICRPVNTVCLDRNNKVFLGKYNVARPCWKEEVTYNCKTEPQDGCRSLINQGYQLYNSTCHNKQESLCLQWKRYYMLIQEVADEENMANDLVQDNQAYQGGGRLNADDNQEDGEQNDRNNRQRIADFPNRQTNAKNGGDNKNTAKAGNNKKPQLGAGGGKNSGFQKAQVIPTKNGSSRGGAGGISSGSATTTSRGSTESSSKNKEEDCVIAESIKIDPDFLLQEGAYIPCSLTTRFVSEVAGRIQCMINQDVYSASGRVKLIERGTKAIGVYQSGVLQNGMARMFVIWTKLLSPDHKRINLADTQVVGTLGEAGIDGRVDSHFVQRFGGALMVSMIKDVVGYATEKNSKGNKRDTININSYENTRDGFTSVAEKMLESSVNIPPTMYKKQGDIVGILVGKDIDFSKIYRLQVSHAD